MVLTDKSRPVWNFMNWTGFRRAICKASLLPVEMKEQNRGT